MDIIQIIILVITAGAVIGGLWYYFKQDINKGIPVVTPPTDGTTQVDGKVALPKSFDQEKGLELAVACWVKIDDFAYRYGQPKTVFVKGSSDLSSMCPALLIDPNTNSFLVKVDTFAGTETIPVGNIPAKKWIHVAISVGQHAVDTYINGKLYLHHTLVNLPKQNEGTLYSGADGGFKGQISQLQYFPYLLTPDQVSTLVSQAPASAPKTQTDPVPPYFDSSFWTNKA
jgi:hypothetical protein